MPFGLIPQGRNSAQPGFGSCQKGEGMNINKFTEKSQEALASAQQLANSNGQQQIDVEHLLLSLLEQQDGLAPAILRKANVNLEELRDRARRQVERLPRVSSPSGEPGGITLTGRLNQVLNKAEDEA